MLQKPQSKVPNPNHNTNINPYPIDRLNATFDASCKL